MTAIHIFNPETDYALASFSPYYTPPASVINLRKDRAFTPMSFAKPGDYILTLDELPTPADLPAYLTHINLKDIPSLSQNFNNTSCHDNAGWPTKSDNKKINIIPWGWNPALKHILAQAGVPVYMLPSDNYLKNLRDISHRRTTIPFIDHIHTFLDEVNCQDVILTHPQEFTDAESAITHYLNNKNKGEQLFFKAPWSSSGRGILFTEELELYHIRPWLRGIIRRQGSIIGELALDKKVDFASEWIIIDNTEGTPEAKFLGYSLFEASRRGKYHSNYDGNPSEIESILKSKGVKLSPVIIEAQKYALEKVCGQYRGYCGIDMLADTTGRIHPCIEINWRITMGLIPLLSEQNQV